MPRGFDFKKARADFPALSQEVYNKPLIYFDSAATAQKPRVVIDAMRQYYEGYCANVNRGAHCLSERASEKFHEARTKISSFLNASAEYQLVFTRSTTEAINLVASSLAREHFRAGDEIILTEMEHHANIVPWYIVAKDKGLVLKVARVLDDGTLDQAHYRSLFSPKTKLAAFAHVSNALGTINPVKEMIAFAKEWRVPVLLDGAQAVPHISVDLSDLDADFYAFSGHKAYGPTGIGAMLAKEKWLSSFAPYQSGGDMISSVSFEHITYASGFKKFEAGTPHIAGALGMASALGYLKELGHNEVLSYELELHAYLRTRLKELQPLKIIGSAKESVSLVSFVVDGIHPHDLSSILDREGIAIRAGHLCAEPLVRRFGHSAFARASLAFYNTKEEVDKLITALGHAFTVFKL